MIFFNPYTALAAAGAALVLSGGSFYGGHHWATTKAEAERAALADAHIKQMQVEIKRADVLAAQLATAEGRIVIKTVEVIKHVPQVTTGTTPCLSADAVSLLNPGTAWGPVYPAAGQPDDSGAAAPATPGGDAAAASDRDVAYWIAEANQQYETAAARLNALINYKQTQGATP